jgi:large subunit ribosomal protein L17
MIHRRKGRKFNRTHSHRKALFSNMCVALIMNKKIKTTLAKAKELRMYVEPLINKSKIAYLAKDSKPAANVHARRVAYGILNDRAAVTALFNEIAPKVVDRNGGYTRVLKMGRRLGDGAELALIELVDYNTGQIKAEEPADSDEKGGKSKAKTKKTTKKTAAETKEAAKPVKKKKAAETKKSTGTKKTTKSTKKKEAAE